MNKSYAKGYRLEAAVVKHLRGLGYEAVRAYGSKGQFGEDITAWVPGWEKGARYLIQCKADGKQAGMMRPKEWNRFLHSAPPGHAVILANGTPAHIRYHEITGPRKEGLTGLNASRDIEANMVDYEFKPVDEWIDETQGENNDQT